MGRVDCLDKCQSFINISNDDLKEEERAANDQKYYGPTFFKVEYIVL